MIEKTIVILYGADCDAGHVDAIADNLKPLNVKFHMASAHRNTQAVLDIVKSYNDLKQCVFITVAGKSNALSGVVAANTKHLVIACPPFNSFEEYVVDIHSSLRMPSGVPVLTIVSPSNCGEAIKRIVNSWLS